MMPLRTDVRVTADIAPAMSPTSSDAAVPDVPPFALSGASPFLHAPDTFFVRIRVIHSTSVASQTVRYYSDLSFLLFAKGFLAVVSQIVFSDLSPIAK
jgi:hypothetical protein